MSEQAFQRALIHLYRTVDATPDPDASFEQFGLTPDQKQWLAELLSSQREALLAYNEQLREKRRRYLRYAMPASRAALGGRFECLLAAYLRDVGLDGPAGEPSLALQFAEHARGHARTGAAAGEDETRAVELLRFEALLVALAAQAAACAATCPTAAAGPPAGRQALAGLRLRLGQDAHLLACRHDIADVLAEPARLETLPRLSEPRWYLLFAARAGGPRILLLAPPLARVLGMFAGGDRLGQVLDRLDSEDRKEQALQSIIRLMELGLPFHRERQRVPNGPGDGGEEGKVRPAV